MNFDVFSSTGSFLASVSGVSYWTTNGGELTFTSNDGAAVFAPGVWGYFVGRKES